MVTFDVMARGLWLSFARLATAGLVGLLVCAPLACGSLLGIDSGTPRGDASTLGDDGASLSDVSTVDPPGDGGEASDGGSRTDGGWPTDGGLDLDGYVGCVSDVNWCDTHCGTGPDNCNRTRDCNTPCPSGESCVANVCKCTQDPSWCKGRCEQTTDNCGAPISCPECAGGSADCHTNVCGCVPDPVATTCAGRQCGQAINNCQLPVNCGVNNTVNCSAGVCDEDAGTCCVPDNSACVGQCMTYTVTCGITVPCPSCASNQVCVNETCCTPSSCSGQCVDNCGQSNNACCSAPPPDGGQPPPVDGGGCGGPGAPCPSPCCSGLKCGYSFQCVTSCAGRGVTCSQPSDCCYGLSCSGVITTLSATALMAGGPDSGIIPVGTCQ
jgi:hypothetical protein